MGISTRGVLIPSGHVCLFSVGFFCELFKLTRVLCAGFSIFVFSGFYILVRVEEYFSTVFKVWW